MFQTLVVNRAALRSRVTPGLIEFAEQILQPVHVVRGRHLTQKIRSGDGKAGDPFYVRPKRDHVEVGPGIRAADHVLDLAYVFKVESLRSQEFFGEVAASVHVHRRVLCTGTLVVTHLFQVSTVMQQDREQSQLEKVSR